MNGSQINSNVGGMVFLVLLPRPRTQLNALYLTFSTADSTLRCTNKNAENNSSNWRSVPWTYWTNSVVTTVYLVSRIQEQCGQYHIWPPWHPPLSWRIKYSLIGCVFFCGRTSDINPKQSLIRHFPPITLTSRTQIECLSLLIWVSEQTPETTGQLYYSWEVEQMFQ